MKKALMAANRLSAIPYLVAFLLVTALAFVIGRLPLRGDKLRLLPWLEFLCGCLTLLVAVGLLDMLGLRGPIGMLIACLVWLIFYARRAHGIVEFCRALAGFLAGWGVYRLC